MQIELVDIDSLTPDPHNARSHEKGVPELAASLSSFGQQKPVVVWGDDVVIAGNGLMEAARTLGWTQLAIVRVPTDWNYDKARAFALADNRTAELSSWNTQILADIRFDLDANGWETGQFGFEPLKLSDYDTTPQLDDVGYAVIIDCDDEQQQSDLLKRFEKQKLRARPLML